MFLDVLDGYNIWDLQFKVHVGDYIKYFSGLNKTHQGENYQDFLNFFFFFGGAGGLDLLSNELEEFSWRSKIIERVHF